MKPRQRFSAANRLKLQRDFARVFARRCSVGGERFVIYADKNSLGVDRLGIRVGKRFGNAVARNAIKRRVRECFRQARSDSARGIDFIVIVRVANGRAPASDELSMLFERAETRLAAHIAAASIIGQQRREHPPPA